MKKLLDLYCKAGGAAMGYWGMADPFEITGIDREFQPRYPFKFIQADAIEYLREHGHEYDFIHASPPCQRNSKMTKGLWKDKLKNHPDLIPVTRELLIKSGRDYVIENVEGAELINPITLCGSMFGLQVRRHRLFECSFPVIQPLCRHKEQGKVIQVNGHSGGSSKRDGTKFGGVAEWKKAMGIYWMTGNELAQAIPPAYTEYISKFIPNRRSTT